MNRIITHTLRDEDAEMLNMIPHDLLSEEETEWKKWILDYKRVWRYFPSLPLFQTEFPNFVSLDPGALSDLMHNTLLRKRRALINEAAAALDSNDVVSATKIAADLLEKLSLNPSSMMDMATLDRKRYILEGRPRFIISEEITEKVKGIRDGEMIAVVGKYATGKSLLTEYSAIQWLLSGERVLVISNDMRSLASAARIDSFLLHTDIDEIDDQEQLDDITYLANLILEMLPGKLVIPERPVKTTSEVAGLAKQEKATMVLIDGSYKLRSPNADQRGGTRSWDNASAVAVDLVAVAHEQKIPVVIVSQANKQGEVAFSRGIAEEADMVFIISDEVDTLVEEGVKVIRVETEKNRRGAEPTLHVVMDFNEFVVRDKLIVT